ncbi:LysE family translocator [Sneathiella glossodoripedis]|uniref:LysE family translocator n=1 Tax=Sneathiella glossodoripedis TaxID=418853 RepID=UPI00046EA2CA|nr:LysE family translocator [Sneathiella glossodoripedis]
MSVAFTALLSYSFINSVTPGPNNIMLASSGVNFGFKRTIPHFLGVYLGFLFMLTIVCFGLGEIFTRFPQIQPILKYAGSGYLLYLAWRIYKSSSISDAKVGKPLTFFEAALFQYINPKAWILAGTIPSAFVLDGQISHLDILYLVGGHALVSLPAILFWVIAGTQLRRLLSTPRTLMIFNSVMALLLVATVGMILIN